MKLNGLSNNLAGNDKSLSNSYLQHIVELLRTEVANLTAKESALEKITKEHIETQKEVVDTKTVNTNKLNANKVTTGSINEKIILTNVVDVLTELKVNGKDVLTDASFSGPFTYKGVVGTLPVDAVAGDVYITNDKVNIYNGTGWDEFTLPVGTVSLAEYNKDKTGILNQIANANTDIEKVNSGLEKVRNDISKINTSLETKVDEAPVDNNPYVRKNGEWADLKLNDNAVKHTAGKSVIDNSENGIKIESPKVEITTGDFKINGSVLPEVDKLGLSKTVETTDTDYWYELKFGRSPFDATSSTRPMYCGYGNSFHALAKANPAVYTVFTKNWQYTKWSTTLDGAANSTFNITAMDKDGNINLIPNDFLDWIYTSSTPLQCSSFMCFNPDYVSEEWQDTVWLFCTGGSAVYKNQKPYLVELKDGRFSRKIDVYNGTGKLKEQGFTPFEEGANMYKELGLTSGKSLRSKEIQRICMVTWDVEDLGSSWAIIIGGDKNSKVTDPFDPSKCIYIPLPNTAFFGYNCMAATDSAWYLQEADTGKMIRITPDGKVTEVTLLTGKSRCASFNYIEYTDINGRPAAAYYNHYNGNDGKHYIVFFEEGENGQVNVIERQITSATFTPVGPQWYSQGFKFIENSYYIFFTADCGSTPASGTTYGSASMKNILWYWDKKTHTTHAINNFYKNITFNLNDFIEMHKTKDNAIWFPYILLNPTTESMTGELNYIPDIDYTDINEENGKDEGAVQLKTVKLNSSFFIASNTDETTLLYSTHTLQPNDSGEGVSNTKTGNRCQLSATNDDGILCIISGNGKDIALCYGNGNFKVYSTSATTGRYDCDGDKEPYLPDLTKKSMDWNKQPNLSGMSHGWVYQVSSIAPLNGQSVSYTYIGLRYKNGEPDITVAPRLSKLVRCGNCDAPQRIKWEKYAYSQTYDDFERRKKTLCGIRAYINYGGAANGADSYFKEVISGGDEKLNLTFNGAVISSVDI